MVLKGFASEEKTDSVIDAQGQTSYSNSATQTADLPKIQVAELHLLPKGIRVER